MRAPNSTDASRSPFRRWRHLATATAAAAAAGTSVLGLTATPAAAAPAVPPAPASSQHQTVDGVIPDRQPATQSPSSFVLYPESRDSVRGDEGRSVFLDEAEDGGNVLVLDLFGGGNASAETATEPSSDPETPTFTPSFPPFLAPLFDLIDTTEEVLVNQVYEAELGRAPTATELLEAKALYDAPYDDADRTALQEAIWSSPSYRAERPVEARVMDVYQELLGKQVTPKDIREEVRAMNGWMKNEGRTLDEATVFLKDLLSKRHGYEVAAQPYLARGENPTHEQILRDRIVQWAVAQAEAPNIGYSQTAGRFGALHDDGTRYFDCSGLVAQAYYEFGIEFGGDNYYTGGMQSNPEDFADVIPQDLSQMQPGDLLVYGGPGTGVTGHVVMYIGDGKYVGAQTSNTEWSRQVRVEGDITSLFGKPRSYVLRPHITEEQIRSAPTSGGWLELSQNDAVVPTRGPPPGAWS